MCSDVCVKSLETNGSNGTESLRLSSSLGYVVKNTITCLTYCAWMPASPITSKCVKVRRGKLERPQRCWRLQKVKDKNTGRHDELSRLKWRQAILNWLQRAVKDGTYQQIRIPSPRRNLSGSELQICVTTENLFPRDCVRLYQLPCQCAANKLLLGTLTGSRWHLTCNGEIPWLINIRRLWGHHGQKWTISFNL